ncbi:hypothetical protein MP228_000761 [Amoeboaphelidium protococcarum]|nr:hypothetical protein MP228_000761 [Amoeboaphelidium protococcarum]
MGDVQQLVRDAEKALATSFFKRKPDYEEASTLYDKAANMLKAQKQYDQSYDLFIKASDCHYKNESVYFAAKSMEMAGSLYIQSSNKNVKKAADAFVSAAKLFQQNNNGDRAIDMYDKAAKYLDEQDPRYALECYSQAVSLIEDEERIRINGEVFQRYAFLLIRENQLQEASQVLMRYIEGLRKAQNTHLHNRMGVSCVIVQLAVGDEVAASKLFEQLTLNTPQWPVSDEGKIANQLLDAFEQRDQQKIDQVLKIQQVSFLDRQIIKLAKSLRVLGEQPAVEQQVYNPDVSTSLVDDVHDDSNPHNHNQDNTTNIEESTDLC